MKRLKKQARKNLALIIGGSLVALLVVGFMINSLIQSSAVDPLIASIESLGTRRIPVEGAVGTGDFDTPTSLFVPIVCSGATTNATVAVASNALGGATWACDPQAGFSFNSIMYKNARGGVTATLTPPAGYSCAKNYTYISTSGGTARGGQTTQVRYKKQARTEGNGCTAKLQPGPATKSVFIWFTVAPTGN